MQPNSKSKKSGENFEHYTPNSHKDIFEVIKNKRSKLLHSVVDFQQLLNLGSSCAMLSVLGHRKWPWLRIITLYNHVYSCWEKALIEFPLDSVREENENFDEFERGYEDTKGLKPSSQVIVHKQY